MLGRDGSVDAWLAQSFEFKTQHALLGQVTKYHSRLAYKESTVSSPKVKALADLHDLIIDSAKNGYTFTSAAFDAYTKTVLGIKRVPPKPAYEVWMNSDDRSTPADIKNSHIIDHILLFTVVAPRMEQLKKDMRKRIELAETGDEELEQLYRRRNTQCRDDPILAEILRHLVDDFRPLIDRYNSSVNPYVVHDGASLSDVLYEHYKMYKSIMPCRTDHVLVQEWLERRILHESTTWELLRASAFFSHHKRRTTCVFLMAGHELCYLKAMHRSESRLIVADIPATYKARKEKLPARGRVPPAAVQTEP